MLLASIVVGGVCAGRFARWRAAGAPLWAGPAKFSSTHTFSTAGGRASSAINHKRGTVDAAEGDEGSLRLHVRRRGRRCYSAARQASAAADYRCLPAGTTTTGTTNREGIPRTDMFVSQPVREIVPSCEAAPIICRRQQRRCAWRQISSAG